MIRRFFKDSLVYTIPTVLSRGLSIFLVPLYTRVLSPSDYGVLDLVMVFGSLVTLTVALEISQAVARFYSDDHIEPTRVLYASTAFWFTCGAYLLFFVFGLAFAEPLGRLIIQSEGYTSAFRLGLGKIATHGVFLLVHNQFRWELKSKKYASISMLHAVTTALVSIVMAYVLRLGLDGMLIGQIVGSAVGLVSALWLLRRTFRFRFDSARLKEMLRFSAPLVPSGIAVFVSNYIDRVMINHFLSLNVLGIYGLGFRLASVVNLVMVGFNHALTPLIYAHHQDKSTPAQIATIFRMFVAAASLFYLFLALFSTEILWIVTTEAFYPAAAVVVLLAPAVLLSNLYIFAPGMAIGKKTQFIMMINIGGAFLHILLNWLLIPLYGYIGAAVATLLGYVAIFAIHVLISQRLYRVPFPWNRVLPDIFVIVLIVGVGSLLTPGTILSIIVKSGLLVIQLGTILLFGLVRIDEIRGLLSGPKRI